MPVGFHCARHTKRRADQTISQAFRSLQEEERGVFQCLLSEVRQRSRVLQSIGRNPDSVALVDVLRNVTTFHGRFVRQLSMWSGCTGSAFETVHSLTNHLLAEYPLPRFLSSVWVGAMSPTDLEHRRWFVEHGAGRRFRDLGVPVPMTRQMEHEFLCSPDHFTVVESIRRAELKVLGADAALIREVMVTRLGTTLDNGEFWRTVLAFLVRYWPEMDSGAAGPIIDFLQAIRHEALEVQTDEGLMRIPPADPDFSMKGRTLASLMRLVERWHRELGSTVGARLRWARSRYRPVVFEDQLGEGEEQPVRWEFIELSDSDALRHEGAALQHCVASYDYWCANGSSRIWSLRRRSARNRVRSVATIEIDQRRQAIVQARGYRNRPVSGKPLSLLREWASRERLTVSL